MKIHEWNEMMAYLTRPAMAYGGRIGFGKGTKPTVRLTTDMIIDVAEKNPTFHSLYPTLKKRIIDDYAVRLNGLHSHFIDNLPASLDDKENMDEWSKTLNEIWKNKPQ